MAAWGKMLGSGAGMAGTGFAIGGPVGAGIGGGLGLITGLLGANAEDEQRRKQAMVRAAEIEAMPWTHQAPSTPIEFSQTNPAGEAVQGIGQGLQAIQGAKANEQAAEQGKLWNQLLQAEINQKSGGMGQPLDLGGGQGPQWSFMGKNKTPTLYGMAAPSSLKFE